MKKIRRKTHILLEQIRDYLAENNGGPMTAMAIKEWHAGKYGRTTPTSNAIASAMKLHGKKYGIRKITRDSVHGRFSWGLDRGSEEE